MRRLSLFGAALLAACGGAAEGITVSGDLAPGGAASPDRVYAVEASQGAELSEGAFELAGLATSPISLRLVQSGDTTARIDIADLPPGSSVELHALRTDARSGRAFPASIELTGAQSVTINGIRMMNADALPVTVDADGVVLAHASDGSALLVRPANDQLPDLRVVVTPVTQIVTRDSLAANLATLSVGDSVVVRGSAERGYVVADRLILPLTSAAPTVSSTGDDGENEAGDASRESGAGARTVAAPVAGASAGPVAVPVIRGRSAAPGQARKQERERGGGGGNGNGKGKGKGKG